MTQSCPSISNLFLFCIFTVLVSCNTGGENKAGSNSESTVEVVNSDTLFNSPDLKVVKISDHVYQHISYLNTQDFGKVECNGMVVTDGGEAVIFDTPTNDAGSDTLIHFVKKILNSDVIAIIPTHFHADCVGGIAAFTSKKIPVHASDLTIQFLRDKDNKYVSEFIPFQDSLLIKAGRENIIAYFPGQGHTRDNVVGYFPAEKIMFGGCLIKEAGAQKGNLEDANTEEWTTSVNRLKNKFPDVKTVIPGHGKTGSAELLDYTADLFRK